MKITREVKIGFIVLIGIVISYVGINYLKGIAVFANQRSFFALYERVEGLQPSNPVVISGYQIGQVRRVTYLPISRQLLVEVSINEKDLAIPKDSRLRIQSSGLLGSKEILLQIGESPELAQHRDTLQTSVETGIMESVNQEILPLKLKTEQLLAQVDSVLTIFQIILDENTQTNVAKSLKSVRMAIQSLELTAFRLDTLVAEERSKLSEILNHVESISGNLAANNDALTNVIQNFSAISDSLLASDLKTVIANASDAMKEVSNITEKINRGEGTMGMLINNDSLYNNLTSASKQLDLLMEDLRVNPDRYVRVSVFGGKRENKVQLSRKDIETLREQLREDLKE
ncbi:MAG: MCE family protein [Cryomorphaceae bacterium]|nr:MAG: MCE family protein [Cryomorphaceae bacterium]